MKFVTFVYQDNQQQAGYIEGGKVYPISLDLNGTEITTMLDFIRHSGKALSALEELGKDVQSYGLEEVRLLAPLPNPSSVRDFMAFEQHLLNASKQSGLTVHPQWYEIPVFYFSNHQSIHGPEQEVEIPPHCEKFDIELEIAAVIGKEGRNIRAEEADEYIFGYTIFNDWSARDLQMQEMQVGLGPAKGKDAATSIGPFIVTKDELEEHRNGDRYDLKMTAKINGKQLSEGNFKDIYYSFGQMIERASSGTTLYPGDIIGSGTVGTGCILEAGPDVQPWLKPGDEVELEIEGLGVLRNRVK
ncbi:fumarylacetoacetate hydrolase family protein [Edaphobacillus lindanitolerans]|uniref:Fumarylacetoacetate hydrolase n=1 Tax=Edaphobacillus lindanitolerans TaxID=550447 RepID=A0A1U7PL47_9BACI|nr:fumarylacetoacetate hydrolase family protein [Edaphobacillus lindanitolerans]SIT73829.1 fumarylacetoacetate hydrolase [Edaphobacillus lindanitolerans]